MADDKKSDSKKKDVDPIDHFYAKHHAVSHIIRSRHEAAVDAHRSGIEALVNALKKNDKNASEKSIEDSHLQTKEFRDIYQKAVVAHFVKAAKKELSIKDDHKFSSDAEADVHHEQLLKLYTGLSKESIKEVYSDFIEKAGGRVSGFTGANFASALVESKYFKPVEAGLNESVASHIEESHLEKIIGKVGITEYISKGKDGKLDLSTIEDKRGLGSLLLRQYAANNKQKLSSDMSYQLLNKIGYGRAHTAHADQKKQSDKSEAEISKKYLPPKSK